MESPLPQELREVESPLLWLDEILSDITKTGNLEEKREVIKGLMQVWDVKVHENHPVETPDNRNLNQNQEGVVIDTDNNYQPCSKQDPHYAGLFAKQLTKAARILYAGDAKRSLMIVDKLKNILVDLTGDHSRLFPVMEYVVQALEWCIAKRYPDTRPLSLLSHDDMVEYLKRKWETILEDPKSVAVVKFLKMKLRMGTDLNNYKSDSKWTHMQEIINLDPEYFMWYHYAYKLLRKIRRVPIEFDEEQDTIKTPSKEEKMMCQKAYDLAPDIMLTNFNCARLLKHRMWMVVYPRLWACRKELSRRPPPRVDPCDVDDFQKTFKHCADLFDRSHNLAMNDEKGNTKWICRIICEKAELPLFVVNSKEEDRFKGLNMLLHGIEKYPENALLPEKLAVIYNHGVPVGFQKHHKDFAESRKFYNLAIELGDYRNYYRCIAHYVKLFKFLKPLPTEEILHMLTKSLRSCILTDVEATRVRTWRGCVHWIYNPEDRTDNKEVALMDWLTALREADPEIVFKIIWNPPFSVFSKPFQWKPAIINTHALAQELSKLRAPGNKLEKAGWSENITLKTMELLRREIERNPKPELSSRNHGPLEGPRTGYEYTYNRYKAGNNGSGDAPKKYFNGKTSVADNDDNWRARKE